MTDIFVSPNGSDLNPGTKSLPYGTIQYAANKLETGDTLWLMDGEYSIGSTSQKITGVNGEDGFPIIISALNEGEAVITGKAGFQLDPMIMLSKCSYIIFDGIWFEDSSAPFIAFEEESTSRCNDITIQNCRFEKCSVEGIDAAYATDIVVSDCIFTNLGGNSVNVYSSSGGIVGIPERQPIESQLYSAVRGLFSPGLQVIDCEFYNNWGPAIEFAQVANGIIRGNRISDSSHSSLVWINGVETLVIDSNHFFWSPLYGLGQDTCLKIEQKIIRDGYINQNDILVANNLFGSSLIGLHLAGSADGVIVPGYGWKNIRILNNTFTGSTESVIKMGKSVGEHGVANDTNCVFANNIIDHENGDSVDTRLIDFVDEDMKKFLFDSNLWSRIPTRYSDLVSITACENDIIASIDFLSEFDTEDENTFKIKIKSPADRTANVDYVELAYDFWGTVKGDPSCRGAHETEPGPDDDNPPQPGPDESVVDFSASPESGTVPLVVTFTADETNVYGTVVAREWYFGEAAPGIDTNFQTIDYLYKNVGKYQVTYTVTLDTGDRISATKPDYVTVNSPGGTSPRPFFREIVTFTTEREDKVQVIDNPLPVEPECIIFGASGTVDDTSPSDGAMLSFGVWTKTGSFSKAIWAEDGGAKTRSYHSTIHTISYMAGGNVYLGKIISVSLESIAIEWSANPPGNYECNLVVMAGDGLVAEVHNKVLPADPGRMSFIVGGNPGLVLGFSSNIWNAVEEDATFDMGYIDDTGEQYGVRVHWKTDEIPTTGHARYNEGTFGYIGTKANWAAINASIESNQINIFTPSEEFVGGSNISYLVLIPDRIEMYAAAVVSPTRVGSNDYNRPGFTPAFILQFMTGLDVFETFSIDESVGAIAIHMDDMATEKSFVATRKFAEPTTPDAKSFTEDSLSMYLHDGTATHVGAVSFATDGWDAIMTQVEETERMWLAFAIEGGTITQPIAGFTLNQYIGIKNATVFVVQDLSVANGVLDLVYEYDWGDGSPISTSPEPSHVYSSGGEYTITQTVTSAADPGWTDSFSVDVSVRDTEPPILNYRITTGTNSKTLGMVSEPVCFYDTSIVPVGTDILAYYWEIINTKTGLVAAISDDQNFCHIFTDPGTFRVRMTVLINDNISVYRDFYTVLTVVDRPVPSIDVYVSNLNIIYYLGTEIPDTPFDITIYDKSTSGGADIYKREVTVENLNTGDKEIFTGRTEYNYTIEDEGRYQISITIDTIVGRFTATYPYIIETERRKYNYIAPPTPTLSGARTKNVITQSGDHQHEIETTITGEPATIPALDDTGALIAQAVFVSGVPDYLYRIQKNIKIVSSGNIMFPNMNTGLIGSTVTFDGTAFSPIFPVVSSLGSPAKIWKEAYIASIQVNEFLSDENSASLRGRIVASESTILAESVSVFGKNLIVFRNIDVKNGDYLWIEGTGKAEIVRAESSASQTYDSNGKTVYSIPVSRMSDLINANSFSWKAGQQIIKLGGSIGVDGTVTPLTISEISAFRPILDRIKMNSSNDAPGLFSYVRRGIGYGDMNAIFASGNLGTLYGHASVIGTIGVGIGEYEDGSVHALFTDGALLIRHGLTDTIIAQFTVDGGLEVVSGVGDQWETSYGIIDGDQFRLARFGAFKDETIKETTTIVANEPRLNWSASTQFVSESFAKEANTIIEARNDVGNILIKLIAGESSTNIYVEGLPTSDPGVPGYLYIDSGILKVSL